MLLQAGFIELDDEEDASFLYCGLSTRLRGEVGDKFILGGEIERTVSMNEDEVQKSLSFQVLWIDMR